MGRTIPTLIALEEPIVIVGSSVTPYSPSIFGHCTRERSHLRQCPPC